MCSIFGAVGTSIDAQALDTLKKAAMDRGRDGGRIEFYKLREGMKAALGNWRATPTPEAEVGPLQPYDRLVHNGTIANDMELGAKPGEIDSQVLARVLDRYDLFTLFDSLSKVRGSYALAMANDYTVLTATNYKPLHYMRIDNAVYFSSMARHFKAFARYGNGPCEMEPYTVRDMWSGSSIPLTRSDNKSVVVIASAGLDSTVAAAKLKREGWKVCLLHFAYQCLAETREIRAIQNIADAMGVVSHVLPLDLKGMLGLGSSTLFGNGDAITPSVQGAEFAHEWVPGRNLVFIALAVAWAEAHGYHAVALGNNLEEAGAYPDNEEQFTTILDQAMPYAVAANYSMRLLHPVGNLMKHEIVKLGLDVNAPLQHTWSCYRGGDVHCGRCGPCFMRRKAFERNGATDPVFNHDLREA